MVRPSHPLQNIPAALLRRQIPPRADPTCVIPAPLASEARAEPDRDPDTSPLALGCGPARQGDLSVSHNNFGDVLVAQGNLPAALESYGASLAIAERLAKADPGNAERQHDLAISLSTTVERRRWNGQRITASPTSSGLPATWRSTPASRKPPIICAFRQALGSEDKLRTWESFEYRANNWSRRRPGIARLEVSMRDDGEHLRQEVDIQAETQIKLHKRSPSPPEMADQPPTRCTTSLAPPSCTRGPEGWRLLRRQSARSCPP
jgi:hypothetical protein